MPTFAVIQAEKETYLFTRGEVLLLGLALFYGITTLSEYSSPITE